MASGSRPYPSTLGKLPDRGAAGGGSGGFLGASSTAHHAREAQRLERERERAERERLEREGNHQFAELSEEQREEINEAVRDTLSHIHTPSTHPLPMIPPREFTQLGRKQKTDHREHGGEPPPSKQEI